jgi:hypothetical protein
VKYEKSANQWHHAFVKYQHRNDGAVASELQSLQQSYAISVIEH